jgi:hypothetical protein
MKVVPVRRSPSGPAEVDAAARSSHGIAVGSTVARSTTLPTTLLPSRACQVGPPKWVVSSLPLSP